MIGDHSSEIVGPSILVVEDDPSSRQALSELLTEDGYQVTTANDGEAALAAVENAVPALIISDVNMPRRNGFELVQALRSRPAAARVPILLLSAVAEPARRAAGLDLGADDFLIHVSIGEATMTPSDTLAGLVERADRAMYRVKRTSQSPPRRSSDC